MKSIVLLLIVILAAFTLLGYVYSELDRAQREAAQLRVELQAAQAALSASQESLATVTAAAELARAEAKVYRQVMTELAQENTRLVEKVRALEAALANTSPEGITPEGAVPPGCVGSPPGANVNWEPLAQPVAALVLALALRAGRRSPGAPTVRGRTPRRR